MGNYKVCVYAIAKNEEKFAKRWMESMQEADEVYVLDTGSEDRTVALLQASGAHVTRQSVEPWRFDVARNLSLDLVPQDCDICVCTDLDEVFRPGWRSLLEDAWQENTRRARYRYVWNYTKDGAEGTVFMLDKIHHRQGFRWTHPVHEVLTYDSDYCETITVPGIQLDHHADPHKSRAQYLPLLELSVREQPEDDRNMHYLGREYMFHGRYPEAIQTLKRHLSLPTALWRDERCASMRYIARCFTALGNPAQAERWLLRACAEAPHLREPWLEMAKFYYEQKNWQAVATFCERALTITERPTHYISEAESFGALPYDLLSLAYYYTGRYESAKSAIEIACQYSPENTRLLENRGLILGKIASKM